MAASLAGTTGFVFSIERFAVHDGPGIRVAVFLKGCPLRCLWCHSPESQSTRPELIVKSDRCIVCGSCVPACAHQAIVPIDGGYLTLRIACSGRCLSAPTSAGRCTDACPTGARTIAGHALTVPALLELVERDRVFFGASGGVTFSGGEPLLQPAFLAEAIAACQAAGLHVAVETSGYGPRSAMDIAARADLLLFDLKVFDDTRHRRMTGVSNEPILENFQSVVRHHRAVRVRVPVIPGLTDDDENLLAIGQFVVSQGVTAIDLLPYHTAGIARYERLDRGYALPNITSLAPEALAGVRTRLERLGLSVHIGG